MWNLGIRAALVLAAWSVALAGCGDTSEPATGTGEDVGTMLPVSVTDAWARPAMQMSGMSTAAVYLTLHNSGAEDDRLVGASTDAAETVELHQSSMEGGVMRMEPVDGIDVPAGETVRLEPGGLHLMLIGLTRDLAAGDHLTITLQFERAGEIEVDVEVREE